MKSHCPHCKSVQPVSWDAERCGLKCETCGRLLKDTA